MNYLLTLKNKKEKFIVAGCKKEIFTIIEQMLKSEDDLGIYSSAWCIAWAGFGGADIIPQGIVAGIAERLVELWISDMSVSPNLKRVISWGLANVCMPGLKIEKRSGLIEVIKSNFNAPGNKIVNEIGEKIASIDLSVRQNRFSSRYISYVNGVSITGASLSKMLSDKIYAISGQNECRRMKDVLDIYVMSFITKINTDELYQIWRETGRELGDNVKEKRQFQKSEIKIVCYWEVERIIECIGEHEIGKRIKKSFQ